MNEIQKWQKYKKLYLRDRVINVASRRIFHHEIKRNGTRSGKENISREEFTDIVKRAVVSKEPYMIARYGSIEATVLFMELGKRLGAIKKVPEQYINKLHINAGFFPIEERMIDSYVDLMLKASDQIDILGYWSTGYQEYLVDRCCRPDIKITDLKYFQPYQAKDDRVWTSVLKNRKVLVIHPFAETIVKQYEKREKIWTNPYILPEFELRTVKAVQTIAGQKDNRFKTWFDALDYMVYEALKDDFDIAVIACGAYGMPLAAKLKLAGKTVMHWGGISQIWFGIKGGRWDNNPDINKYYNENWVRPSDNETPNHNYMIEGSCYW